MPSNFFRNPSFSCLDTRKGCEKKIKASGMPANLAGHLIFSLFIFRFLLSPRRGVSNTPSKRPDRGDLIYLWVGVFIPAGYILGVCNTPLPYRQEISPIYIHNVYHVRRPFRFLISLFRCTRVGAYCIRPTNAPAGADSRRWEGSNFYRPAHITWREGALPPRPYFLFLP